MPRRWVRVLKNLSTLTWDARCRYCGRLAYSVTAEYLARTRSRPQVGALHDCPKLDDNRQLIHNGRKP